MLATIASQAFSAEILGLVSRLQMIRTQIYGILVFPFEKGLLVEGSPRILHNPGPKLGHWAWNEAFQGEKIANPRTSLASRWWWITTAHCQESPSGFSFGSMIINSQDAPCLYSSMGFSDCQDLYTKSGHCLWPNRGSWCQWGLEKSEIVLAGKIIKSWWNYFKSVFIKPLLTNLLIETRFIIYEPDFISFEATPAKSESTSWGRKKYIAIVHALRQALEEEVFNLMDMLCVLARIWKPYHCTSAIRSWMRYTDWGAPSIVKQVSLPCVANSCKGVGRGEMEPFPHWWMFLLVVWGFRSADLFAGN